MITRNTDYSIQRLRGLSTDTKPVNVPNGSEFREMDTGKKFLFSAAGTEWIEQSGSGGSGGGGSGSGVFIVTVKTSDGSNFSADKTNTEIYEASVSGMCPIVRITRGTFFMHMFPLSVEEDLAIFAAIPKITGVPSIKFERINIDNNKVSYMKESYPSE